MIIYDSNVWKRLSLFQIEEVTKFRNGSTTLDFANYNIENDLICRKIEIFGIEYVFCYRYKNKISPELCGIVTNHIRITLTYEGFTRVLKRHDSLSQEDVDLHLTMLLTCLE